jgi:uncharacterized protein (TIGR03437 family)
MKAARTGSDCRIAGTFRLTLAFSLFAAHLFSQSVAGNITTTSLPFFGQTIFDSAGNMYITGTGGPITPGAAQTQTDDGLCLPGSRTARIGVFPAPCTDAYIGKFDPSGNTIFGTWLGGPLDDAGVALTLDTARNVYIVGTTGGSFPTTPNAAIAASTTSTTFAAEVSADGSHFIYVTYLPASATMVNGIAVDSAGNAYIVGQNSAGHAFLTKLAAGGSSFAYTVTLAGSGQDVAKQVVLDASGNIVIAGQTNSPDFPVTAGVVQANLAGAQNLFLAKLSPAGSTIFATYLGGNGSDTSNVLQLDSASNLYVGGSTTSYNLPTTPGSFQPTAIVPIWNNFGPGGFVAKLTSNGSALVYSSYAMSQDSLLQNGVAQLAVGAAGDLYFAGITGPGFPITPSAPQGCFADGADVFVVHVDRNGATLDSTYVSSSVAGDTANFAEGLRIVPGAPLTLVWHAAGNNVLSQITFGSGGWTAPACLSNAVLNGAAFYANGAVSAGEIISLTGYGIGPPVGVSYQPTAQGTVPTQAGGVQVLINNQPAPVLYAQSNQVNAIVPQNVSGTVSIALTYNGTPIGSTSAQVVFGVPGLFRAQAGYSTQVLALNADGTPNSASNPAPSGSVVMLLGTGFGPTSPACTPGGLNDDFAANLASGLSVTTNQGNQKVTYAGSSPTLLCGITQLNLMVQGDPSGALTPIALQAWSVMSVPGGTETAEGNFVTSTLYVK